MTSTASRASRASRTPPASPAIRYRCTASPGTTPNGGSFCDEVAVGFQVPFPVEANGDAAVFGPYDLAHYGVNSTQQLEDQANFLYNYATVVGVDAPLDKPCGPAIGATACSGHRTPTPRSITMVAYDSEGTPSAPVTQSVPLTPASNPSFSVCVEDISRHTPCVTTPVSGSPLPFTIRVKDKLRFELTGGTGGDNPIAYYTVAVGQPNTANVKYLGNQVTTDCVAPSIVGSWTAPGTTTSHSTTTTAPAGGGGQGASGPVSGTKQPATGPKASADVSRPGGLITTGTPVPPFSDLEAGDFPAHNCDGYVARTVNASAPPGKAPTSGPNVKLHSAIAHPTGPPKPVSGSFPSLQAALHPVAVRPAPGIADPILVTSNQNALNFTFDKKGTYSTSIAAYSSAGLGAITRIDGFLAENYVHTGRCVTVQSQNIAIPVPHRKSKFADVAFSGNCVTVTAGDNLFVSSEPIDVSGVPLAPRAGESIVIDPDEVPTGFYVAPCSISDAQLKKDSNPCPDKGGTLYLALGGGSKTAPGLAELRDFTTKTADKWFLPLASGTLPAVGKTPKQGKSVDRLRAVRRFTGLAAVARGAVQRLQGRHRTVRRVLTEW